MKTYCSAGKNGYRNGFSSPASQEQFIHDLETEVNRLCDSLRYHSEALWSDAFSVAESLQLQTSSEIIPEVTAALQTIGKISSQY